MRVQSFVSQAKTVKGVFSEKNVTFLAGSIAYSAFISLVPLVMFFLFAVSLFGSPELQARLIEVLTDSVSPSVSGVIEVMIEQERDASASSTIVATVVGVLALVWGAIKVFRGLDTAFSEIYETTATESTLGQIKKSLLVLVTLTLGVIAMVAATSVVAFVSSVPLLGFFVPLVLLAALVGAFFPMYYLFPDLDLEPREVLPGAVVGAVGWTGLQVLFQLYASLTGGGEGNLIAAILLLVTWLYFGGLVLLLGAVVNAVVRTAGDDVVDPRDELSALDVEMGREELATYLRRLREDLTHVYEGMRPMRNGTVVKRTPLRGEIAVTEWAQPDEAGVSHVVRLRWHSERGQPEEPHTEEASLLENSD